MSLTMYSCSIDHTQVRMLTYLHIYTPHALMARDGLTKKTPAWHFLVPRGSFAVTPCKVLAARVALQGASRVKLHWSHDGLCIFDIDAASNFKRPTRTQWSLTREAPGVPRGPPKPCTGTRQNTRVELFSATREFFLWVRLGPLTPIKQLNQ